MRGMQLWCESNRALGVFAGCTMEVMEPRGDVVERGGGGGSARPCREGGREGGEEPAHGGGDQID